MILCGNPHAQYIAHKAEIDAAVLGVMEKGWFVLGDEVRAFESELTAYLGVAHGVGVGSGTEALHLALVACGIGRGDEVITVAHTAVATVAAIELCGATPVLVDIDADYYTLDPTKLEEAIGPRTRAVIPVHLYGQAADLSPVIEIAGRHGLRVIEDCAQAHGAIYQDRRVGAWGDMACFSFYPTKNLGALGDGGMVVTNDPELANRARLLREYGWSERNVSTVAGWNTRLDELQAAVLRVKLGHLDRDNLKRRELASFYGNDLSECELRLPRTRAHSTHVYHLYVVRTPDRDNLQSFLRSRGIGALVHYPVPIHQQPAYVKRLSGADKLRETERAAREVLSLPIYPELNSAEANQVVTTVRQYFNKAA